MESAEFFRELGLIHAIGPTFDPAEFEARSFRTVAEAELSLLEALGGPVVQIGTGEYSADALQGTLGDLFARGASTGIRRVAVLRETPSVRTVLLWADDGLFCLHPSPLAPSFVWPEVNELLRHKGLVVGLASDRRFAALATPGQLAQLEAHGGWRAWIPDGSPSGPPDLLRAPTVPLALFARFPRGRAKRRMDWLTLQIESDAVLCVSAVVCDDEVAVASVIFAEVPARLVQRCAEAAVQLLLRAFDEARVDGSLVVGFGKGEPREAGIFVAGSAADSSAAVHSVIARGWGGSLILKRALVAEQLLSEETAIATPRAPRGLLVAGWKLVPDDPLVVGATSGETPGLRVIPAHFQPSGRPREVVVGVVIAEMWLDGQTSHIGIGTDEVLDALDEADRLASGGARTSAVQLLWRGPPCWDNALEELKIAVGLLAVPSSTDGGERERFEWLVTGKRSLTPVHCGVRAPGRPIQYIAGQRLRVVPGLSRHGSAAAPLAREKLVAADRQTREALQMGSRVFMVYSGWSRSSNARQSTRA